MDRIDFARLISVVTEIFGRRLSYDELRDIETTTAITPQGRADISSLNVLLGHMNRKTNKIDAIKEYRALTGCTLKDSKDAVEAFWPVLSEHAIPTDEQAQALTKRAV